MKKHEVKIHNYTVMFEPAAGGGYNAVVPALPDIAVHGKTLKETRALVKETLERHIETMQANNTAQVTIGRLIDETQHYMINNSRIGMP